MSEQTPYHLCCRGHGWRYHSRYLNTSHHQCCRRGRIYCSRYVNIYLIVTVVLVMVGDIPASIGICYHSSYLGRRLRIF